VDVGTTHRSFGKEARAVLVSALAMVGVVLGGAGQAVADPLLDEVVEFTGAVLFLEHKVPALVIGAVRDGETAIYGFGETSDSSEKAPGADTLFRIGSITKAFTGDVVSLTDPLTKYAPDLAPSGNEEAQAIRLIDLATQSAGTPREVPHEPGPKNDPFAPITRDAFAAWLAKEKLLFPPSSGVFYSNFGFDLLEIALSEAAETSYPDLLKAKVTAPLGLRDTVFAPPEKQKARMMQGKGASAILPLHRRAAWPCSSPSTNSISSRPAPWPKPSTT
jgi:D-alanyl-D-alanine-carboxypeptidase/D-alanyl-D-alanine-endopeptidase